MKDLRTSIDGIIDSYGAYGLINHSGGPNLPNRQSVSAILRDLDAILFPGFREDELLDEKSLPLATEERVFRTARALTREVEKSLSYLCRSKNPECTQTGCQEKASTIVSDFFEELPQIRRILSMDVAAAFKGDPASKSIDEVIVSYPGLQAISVHRLAHFLWTREVPLIPRIMSEIVHGRTGIDIHPGASIGESFFIDHGTGVVVGETTVIGRNVKIYQGVTLGALSVKKTEANTKRHPTIGDDVTIYSGATILGGCTVIGDRCTIGGNVWITESVPADTLVYAKGIEYELRTREAPVPSCN